jgi:hypothetical protein
MVASAHLRWALHGMCVDDATGRHPQGQDCINLSRRCAVEASACHTKYHLYFGGPCNLCRTLHMG